MPFMILPLAKVLDVKEMWIVSIVLIGRIAGAGNQTIPGYESRKTAF